MFTTRIRQASQDPASSESLDERWSPGNLCQKSLQISFIPHERVRNANQVPTPIRVRREGSGPGRLVKERAPGNRISVVFTVGGPLVYQPQRVRVA